MRFPGQAALPFLSVAGSLFSAASGFMGGGKSSPAPAAIPEVVEPAVMPDPDDQALKRRRRRKISQQRMRSGRMATTDSSSLGTGGTGGTYG